MSVATKLTLHEEISSHHHSKGDSRNDELEETTCYLAHDENAGDKGQYQNDVESEVSVHKLSCCMLMFLLMFLRIIGFKEPAEGHGDGRAELHRLVGDRMIEAEHVGMKAETSDRIVAIAVFDVATDRMSHVG